MFILLSRIDPPFSNQMVLEGAGALDLPRWEKAVAAACEANPGSRLIYKGGWRRAKWVDAGIPTPVRVVDGAPWSGDGPDGAPFLFDPLPFKHSHSCEVLLVQGHPPRVVIRTLHATMDGGGTIFWAYDIFRALRGEPLVGSACTLTDMELLSGLNYPPRKRQKHRKCLAPTGAMDGDGDGFVWQRTRVPGKYSKLLPQAAVAIARETRQQGPTHVAFNVPFDLRLRIPGIRSTANLSRRIVLHLAPEATVQSVHAQMQHHLENPCRDPRLLNLVRYVPLGWIERLFKHIRKKNLSSGHYHTTGSISNLGRLRLELLQGGGFQARTVFFVPPGTEAKPFFMTLSGGAQGVEMVVSMPKALASHGRLERFMANVAAALKPS